MNTYNAVAYKGRGTVTVLEAGHEAESRKNVKVVARGIVADSREAAEDQLIASGRVAVEWKNSADENETPDMVRHLIAL